MRKIINNKAYDTDTATPVGIWDNGLSSSDFDFCREELFRKKTGEYFLDGDGGARSRYSKWDGGCLYGIEKIVPLSYEQAREWAEEHLSAEEYEAEFGEVSEGDDGVTVLVVKVSTAAKKRLDRTVSKSGKTQQQVVDELLLGLH